MVIIIRSVFTRSIVALVLAVFLASFLRFYKIGEIAKFSFDQARDDLIVKELIQDKKVTLLGPETRIGNKLVYFGPFHYYLIAPALAIGKLNPLWPYYLTALLGVSAVALTYLVTKNFFSALFFACFPLLVISSRFAWNPNTIPFFAVLFIWAIKSRRFLLSGFLLALAIQLHPTAAALLIFAVWYLRSEKSRLSLTKVLIGTFIGLLPILLFDLRHNFLYFRSFLSITPQDLSSGRSFNWHYFLWVFPSLAIWLGTWPKKISAVAIATSFSLSLLWLSAQKIGDPMSFQRISAISETIANDQRNDPLSFNIASFVDPDTRATVYRYFLSLDGVSPLGVGEYGVADHLYVITFEEPETVLYNKTYEISSLSPKRISRIWDLAGEKIYRLERN